MRYIGGLDLRIYARTSFGLVWSTLREVDVLELFIALNRSLLHICGTAWSIGEAKELATSSIGTQVRIRSASVSAAYECVTCITETGTANDQGSLRRKPQPSELEL